MKWILIALLLLALAFIVYAIAGRRGTAAGRDAAADLRGLGASGAGTPATPGGPVPALAPAVEPQAEPEPGESRSTIFDGPPPADESADARHEEAATSAASSEPEEGDMFGWGKDKKDDSEDAVVEETTTSTREAPSEPVVSEDARSEDDAPRRGAGVDDAATADQPSWTTSAHDADHTVAEERSDGERTTFDEDVTTTADADRTDESHEGAFDTSGADDIVDHAPSEDDGDSGARDDREASASQPADAVDGVAGDQGEGASDLREEQAVDREAEQGAGAGDADESAAQGSQEAYEAGQRAGAETDSTGDSDGVAADDDALEGAQDGSVGAEVLHGGSDAQEPGGPGHTGGSDDDGGPEGSDDSGASGASGESRDEEPADPAEFRQPGDWAAGEGDAEVQKAEEAAELRGGPTVLPDGTVAGPEQSGDGESGDPDASAAVASDSGGADSGAGGADTGGNDGDADSGTVGDSGLGAGQATGTEDGAEQMDAEGAAQAQGDVSSNDHSEGGAASEGSEGTWTRRTSDLDEVRDGGYGVGSAATFEDRAMPLGHPVKAWEDTKTFVEESHPSYEEAEPHVWFADAEAAERAGFRRVD